MKELSQPILHFIYKHPRLLKFLTRKPKCIEHKVVEMSEFKYEPTLDDLEEMILGNEFQDCLWEMYLYTCSP